jgi:hypothetical protein
LFSNAVLLAAFLDEHIPSEERGLGEGVEPSSGSSMRASEESGVPTRPLSKRSARSSHQVTLWAVGAALLMLLVGAAAVFVARYRPPAGESAVQDVIARGESTLEESAETVSAPAAPVSVTPATVVSPPVTSPAQARSVRRSPDKRGRSTTADPVRSPPVSAKPAAQVERVGYLYFDTAPWTNVLLDGELLGPTPLLNRPLRPGSHTLTLVDSKGRRYQERVEISTGKTTKRFVTLEGKAGAQ